MQPAGRRTSAASAARPLLDACYEGTCGHFHPAPAPDDPLLAAERRVRDALHDLRSAVEALPPEHSLRRDYLAGDLYASWSTRAAALLWRIQRERHAWRRIHRTLRRGER